MSRESYIEKIEEKVNKENDNFNFLAEINNDYYGCDITHNDNGDLIFIINSDKEDNAIWPISELYDDELGKIYEYMCM